MKIKVDRINSVKPSIDGRSNVVIELDVNLTKSQAERLFYDIWEDYDIEEWIRAEGYQLSDK